MAKRMGTYATEQSFGGQKASVGRTVVVLFRGRFGIEIRAGVIAGILDDRPEIALLDDPIELTTRWEFVETKTEADVESMPIGSWTWPVRVA